MHFILIWLHSPRLLFLRPYKPSTVLCNFLYKRLERASLVAQWLRICLPTQGTWVQALVREDPTWRGATKPVCHNY